MSKFVKKIVAIMGAFCILFCGACQEEEGITVYMPDGAPALALAGMMAADTATDGVEYRVVTPSLIASKVTNKEEDKNADFCVMPVTAASKLLGKGEQYVMLGTLTHGNLYLVAKSGGTIDNLHSLVGKRVGVLQINEVPGLTFKATLRRKGIAYRELTNTEVASEHEVNLVAISGADALAVTQADCFLLAEPSASAQSKNGYQIVGNLQTLYGEEKGYPQAVLVAKRAIVENRSEWTKSFIAQIETSISWAQKAHGEEIVSVLSSHLEDKTAASSLKATLLTPEVVARCGIGFSYAMEQKGECEGFLSVLMQVNDKAAAIPAEKFYWSYTK